MKTDTTEIESRLMTIEEFERLPDDEWRYELVRGRLVQEPPSGFEHSGIGVRIASLLWAFVREHGLGEVVGADGGFILSVDPPTVRAPDVAFVQADRLDFDRTRFAPLAPDLAVEVISPSNTLSEIQEKILDYLDAGTRLAWVVDPGTRTVTVWRSREEIRLVGEDGQLDGEDVLPDLRIPVSTLFGR